MSTEHHWEFFDTADLTHSAITRELKGARLTPREEVRLNTLLERVVSGTAIPTKDFKHLDGELWEVRFHGDRRIFRLLYSPQPNGTLVLVALRFLAKKSQKTPRQELRTARKRLESWKKWHPPQPDITDE